MQISRPGKGHFRLIRVRLKKSSVLFPFHAPRGFSAVGWAKSPAAADEWRTDFARLCPRGQAARGRTAWAKARHRWCQHSALRDAPLPTLQVIAIDRNLL